MQKYIQNHIHILITSWCTAFILMLQLILSIVSKTNMPAYIIEWICYLFLFIYVLLIIGNDHKTTVFKLVTLLGMLLTFSLLFTYERPTYFSNYPAYPVHKEIKTKTIFDFPTITVQNNHNLTVRHREQVYTIDLDKDDTYILVYNPVCPICQDSTKLFTMYNYNTDKINVYDYQIVVANTLIESVTKPLIEKYNVSEIPSIIHLKNGKLVDVLPLYNEQTNQFVTTTQLKQWLQQ